MRKLGELIAHYVPEIARTETQDTGQTISQTISQTGKQLVPRAADNFSDFAEMCTRVDGHTYPTSTHLNYNLGRAHRVAAAVEAGMCFVNTQNLRDLRQPFGGTKASGTGREGGTWSYEVFLEPKNIAVSLGDHHIPHWDV